MVSFYKYITDECQMCNTEGDLLAHDNGGKLHPVCENAINRSCPYCRAPVDVYSLYTMKELAVIEGKKVLTDLLNGVLFSGISLAAQAATEALHSDVCTKGITCTQWAIIMPIICIGAG